MPRRFQHPRKVFEPADQEETLKGWLFHSHKSRQRHDWAARRFERQRLWIGGLAATLAAVVGASVFVALQKETGSNTLKVVVGMVSVISAVLAGLTTFLNLSERVEKHRLAGVRYKAMIREIESLLAQEAEQATETIDDVRQRLDKLEETAPVVPENIFGRVDEIWDESGVEIITSASDFYLPQGQSRFESRHQKTKV